MSKRRRKRRKRKQGTPGNGMGPHQEVSPMGHATRTLSREGRRRKRDRKAKQKGWQNE